MHSILHAKNGLIVFLIAAFVIVLLIISAFPSIYWMVGKWLGAEEYSHGIMIPLVSGYLVWQRRATLSTECNNLNFAGLFVFVLGLFVGFVASLATVHVAVNVGVLLCIYGLVIQAIGWSNTKALAAPLLILLFMFPMPNFINANLSSELQLISSELGVVFIRLFDIIVYLEGNVIDLGSYKLQVVEACSGLRYLYPLVALGFILAYLCAIPIWMKATIFLSTIPITVIMNSIRIGAIGVTVEYWGPTMAEGLLHDFEGWFMFMASLGVVFLELLLLLRLTGDTRSLAELISFDSSYGASDSEKEDFQFSKINAPIAPLAVSCFLVAALSVYQFVKPAESERVPERLSFNHFPLIIGEWLGSPQAMDDVYIDALKFDDYIMADYRKGSSSINLYVSYYGSQRAGQSAHSPRSCIPGGGWRIESIESLHLGGFYIDSEPLNVNRVLIKKGDFSQVVYYWFQQRGRIITNEYLVKWYLFWDALTINRTDGAMVRLVVPLEKGQSIEEADRIATDFVGAAQFRLSQFIPGNR